MRDYLIFGILFGSLPFILWRPYLGVCLWAWISYMNPHRFAWDAYDFPVAALVAAATLAGLVLSREPKRIPITPVTVTLMLFVAWMCLTTLFALIPEDAVDEWNRAMKIQLITFVSMMVLYTRERIYGLVLVIAASIGFFGVKGGLFTLLSGGDYTVFGPPDSFIADNNTLALALIMVLPLMRYLQLQFERKSLQFGMLAIMLLTLVAIIGSYSRGAFLALVAVLALGFLRTRRKFVLLLVAALALPLIGNALPEAWVERMETIRTYHEDDSAIGRVNAWWFAFNLAKDRPLVGGGYEAFDPGLFERYAPDPADFHDAHSVYFEVLGEHGFVGLFLFLLLGILAYRAAGRTIQAVAGRSDLKWAAHLAAMCQLSLVGYAVGGAFLGLAYFDLYYHVIALIVVTRAVVEQSLAGRPAATAVETQPSMSMKPG